MSAIFIVVIIALLGASMVQIVGQERRSSSLAHLEDRAYRAAVSGLEWAVYQARSDPTTCPASSFNLTEGGVQGFSVAVTCALSGGTGHYEGGTPAPGDGDRWNVFVVTATATRGSFGDADFVRRTAEAIVTVDPAP